MIKSIGHVAIQVPDLEATVAWATTMLGLREVERRGDSAFLTNGSLHHTVQYILGSQACLDHVSLETGSADDLYRLRDSLAREGARVTAETPQEPGISAAVRFIGPEGIPFEVYAGMAAGQPSFVPSGVRPKRFGHITLKCTETVEMASFLVRVLGFRLSDDVGPGILTFLRCNSDHHGLAMAKGPAGLHHYAWEVQSLMEIARLADLLDMRGQSFLWGPGRHGAGENIFSYHLDPAGCIVEYYTDMERIYDESRKPVVWDITDPRFANLWGSGVPDGFIDRGQPVAGPSTLGLQPPPAARHSIH